MADTGATAHFIMVNGPVMNVTAVRHGQGLCARLPSGAFNTSTHEGSLNIQQLPAAATKCHIFPKLQAGSLKSIGQLYDYGFTAFFTAATNTIELAGHIILSDKRMDGLWTINMHQPVPLDNFHFNYLPFVQSQQEKSQQETQQRNLLRSSQSQHTVLSIQSQQEKSRQETQHTALFASTAVAARVAFLHAVCFSPAIST